MNAHTLVANNIARDSENKMHDDAVARKLGFAGGLVPGIAIFGYMSHMPVAKWGKAFLERGVMEGQFLKPVYDGDAVVITAEETKAGIAIKLECRNTLCATGLASLPEQPEAVTIRDFEKTLPVPDRRPVSASSYREGAWLGTTAYSITADKVAEALRSFCETNPLYEEQQLSHPVEIPRLMNHALMENAILGPWIHVSSKVHFLATAAPTDSLTARAKVTGNFDRKGHKFVELDGIVVANENRPIAHCQHTAIYQLRERANTAE